MVGQLAADDLELFTWNLPSFLVAFSELNRQFRFIGVAIHSEGSQVAGRSRSFRAWPFPVVPLSSNGKEGEVMGIKEIEGDVLVVGSGLAGIMAAVEAARMGCKVVLTSKGSMKSGNSVLVGGGWLVASKDFPHDE